MKTTKILLNIISYIAFAVWLGAISLFFYTHIQYKASNPCPTAEESPLCETDAEYVGLGSYESYIPSQPACGCDTEGQRIFFLAAR